MRPRDRRLCHSPTRPGAFHLHWQRLRYACEFLDNAFNCCARRRDVNGAARLTPNSPADVSAVSYNFTRFVVLWWIWEGCIHELTVWWSQGRDTEDTKGAARHTEGHERCLAAVFRGFRGRVALPCPPCPVPCQPMDAPIWEYSV